MYARQDTAGIWPQATVMLVGGFTKCACVAAETVIVLDVVIFLPHWSVNDHVSVTVPPHAVGVALNVDELDVPDIKHDPVNPLL